MNKLFVAFACAAFGSVSSVPTSAAPQVSLSPADQAWTMLQMPPPPVQSGSERSLDPARSKAAAALRGAEFVAQADRAKQFHAQFPEHSKAGEAKLLEIRALVGAVHTGDATVEGRLASAVQAVREDPALPSSLRVRAVAAYEFERRPRGLKTHEERLKAIEQVARDLAQSFPDQPQGFESLVAIAVTDQDESNAKKIARDLLAMPAPEPVKSKARVVLSRFELIGKQLVTELEEANETAAKTVLRSQIPTVIYTWVSSNPVSLALAAELKQRHLTANLIGLNLDTDRSAAEAVALKEGLVGTMVYDARGREGALAQRLKFGGPGEVILVDERGVIREVRAQGNLSTKLKQMGL